MSFNHEVVTNNKTAKALGFAVLFMILSFILAYIAIEKGSNCATDDAECNKMAQDLYVSSASFYIISSIVLVLAILSSIYYGSMKLALLGLLLSIIVLRK